MSTVRLTTSRGLITLELASDKAPGTCASFEQYVRDGHYDGTVFHRVIDGFMLQGGGFTADLTPRPPRAPIQNEANNGLKNTRGTVAMARKGDPHSATCQFFINVADNAFLDHPGRDGWGYCVFAKVVDGMDTVDAIRQVKTHTWQGRKDVPVEPVVIEKAERVE